MYLNGKLRSVKNIWGREFYRVQIMMLCCKFLSVKWLITVFAHATACNITIFKTFIVFTLFDKDSVILFKICHTLLT